MPQIPLIPRPSTAETIYLVGTSGHPNFGDEFITAAWLRLLSATRPHADVWLDCPNPGLASHLFDRLHPRLRITNSLWRLVHETRDMDESAAGSHIDRVVTHLGSPQYDLGLLRAREASSIHLIGGAYINALWPHHRGLFRAALRIRDLTGARLLATGLGLTPAGDPESLIAAVNAFDHFSVRDAPSAELTGAQPGCDDAFLFVHQVPGFRDGSRDDDVWVCLQSDMTDPETFEAAVEAVRSALTGPELSGRTIRYLEGMPRVDRIAFDRLSDLIPEENFLPFVRVWQDGFPARAGQTWLTSRFHFHLLAAACGAEGTALEVSKDHYRVPHESLIDAGSGWALNPMGSRTVAAPTGAGAFRGAAARLRQAKRQEALALYPELPADPPEQPPAPDADHRSRGLRRRR